MMLTTDLTQLTPGDRVLLPLHCLIRSSRNHRRGTRGHTEQDAELRASLKAHGVIENLAGHVDGDRFAITAGGRRLTQLQWLARHGEIADDHAVPCFVHAIEAATDISLTENIQRLPPHPADVFEAFAALEKQGLSAQAIANRYGRTEAEVQRFLRLGTVHPSIFKHFRSGAMAYDQIRAYAITGDRQEQLRVFKALGSQADAPAWRIREQFRQSRLGADSKLIRFVTLNAYRRAGGRTEVDLFSENEQLLDVELLDSLCEAKLERQRRRLEKEGWKWIEVAFDGDTDWRLQRLPPSPAAVPEESLSTLAEKQTRLARLQAQQAGQADDVERDQQIATLIEELAQVKRTIEDHAPPAFSAAQKAHAGAQAFVNARGRFEIVRALVRPADARALAQRQASDDGDASSAEEAGPSPISQALRSDLRLYRNRCLQAALVSQGMAARDLIDYQLCLSVFLPYQGNRSLNLRLEADIAESSLQDLADSPVMQAIEAARKALSLAWVEAETDRERFEGFRGLSGEERQALLAYVAAVSLIDGTSGDKDKASTVIATECGWQARQYWSPTAANYFGRLKRDRLLALGVEWYGESFASEQASASKKALVERFDALFNENEGALDEHEREIRRSWVPPEMQ